MDLNQRLEQQQSGQPTYLHPDEQREFLGVFAERVLVAVHHNKLADPETFATLTAQMTAHPNAQLLLAQPLLGSHLKEFVNLAKSNHNRFTLQTSTNSQSNNPVAVVLAADTAQANAPLVIA